MNDVLLHGTLLVLAGFAAGTINTVVGSGSLVTFPTLLMLGYPPLLANVTNNVGILPGSLSGAYAYRRELAGQRRVLLVLGTTIAIGGVIGALLLLVLPSSVFDFIVPILVAVALVLVIIGPWLKRKLAANRAPDAPLRLSRLALLVGVTGVYGGYFGAAQGIILISILSIALPGDLNRANAVKNLLSAIVNIAASIIFVFTTHVDWVAAGLLAVGAIIGGQVGGRIGRKIPDLAYRIVIVVIGVFAIISLLT